MILLLPQKDFSFLFFFEQLLWQNCYQLLPSITKLSEHRRTELPVFWRQRIGVIWLNTPQQCRFTVCLWPWNDQKKNQYPRRLRHWFMKIEPLVLTLRTNNKSQLNPNCPVVVRIQPHCVNSCLVSERCWVCRWAGRQASWRLRFSFVDCYRQRVDTCQERRDHQSE